MCPFKWEFGNPTLKDLELNHIIYQLGMDVLIDKNLLFTFKFIERVVPSLQAKPLMRRI